MNAAFRPKGRRKFYIMVPVKDGRPVMRPATRDSLVAKQMQAMVDALGHERKRAWDLLELVTAKVPKIKLSRLWDAWGSTPVTRHDKKGEAITPAVEERIAHMRRELLEVVDLEPYVEQFYRVTAGSSSNASVDTAAHYRAGLRTLITKGTPFLRSRWREDVLAEWIEGKDELSPATVRKHGVAARLFEDFLNRRGALHVQPMHGIKLPAAGDPRCHSLETHEAQLLADANPGQHRLFSATLAGSAMEVSTGLSVLVRDVSRDERMIRAPGTKNYNRDRMVRVADWAWPYVEEALSGKTPNARLFDQIADRWDARDAHYATVLALAPQLPKLLDHQGYWLRDHRHTWAVRAIRSGWPVEAVRLQLGHINGVLVVKVYAKFFPRREEIDRWERMATERDAARVAELKRDAQ